MLNMRKIKISLLFLFIIKALSANPYIYIFGIFINYFVIKNETNSTSFINIYNE